MDEDYHHQKEQFFELIEPFTIHFDDHWNRYYYYNSEKEESVWELPIEIQEKLKEFYEKQKQDQDFLKKTIMSEHISQEKIKIHQLIQKTDNPYLGRPARK